MKKFNFFIITIFIIGGAYVTLHSHSQHPAQLLSHASSPSPTQEQIANPKELIISKIHVDANVESVGLTSEGAMDVPKHNEDVAWYNLGSKPGQKGSAVIDGHLDTVTGAPAVFWNIAKLQPGDTITVVASDNKKYTFSVVNTTTFPYNQVPLKQVFASNDKARLNLITCGGTWNQASHNYSNRTVVYAILE